MTTYSKFQVETAIAVAIEMARLLPEEMVSAEKLLATFPWATLEAQVEA